MSAPIDETIANSRSLREALLSIADEPDLSTGVLKVSEGPIRGSVCFSNRILVGAFLHNTGESGKIALRKLLLLDRASIRLTAANRRLLPSGENLSVNFKLVAFPGADYQRGLPSGPGRYDQLLSRHSTQDDLRRFEEFTGALDANLSVEQKTVLEALATYLTDKDSFEELDHQLQMSSLTVRQEQLQNLANALMAFDSTASNFHDSDFRLEPTGSESEADRLTDLAQAALARPYRQEKADFEQTAMHAADAEAAVLTVKQLQALGRAVLIAARQKHGAEFEASNALLQDSGLNLTQAQLQRLSEALMVRSTAEQLREFFAAESNLDTKEGEQFYAFVEPEAAPAVVVEELDAIAAPQITDADRQALVTAAHEKIRPPVRKSSEGGIINRARDALTYRVTQWVEQAHEAGDERSQHLAGVIALSVIALVLVLVPGLILMINTGKSAAQLNQDLWRRAEQLELAEQSDSSHPSSGAYQLPGPSYRANDGQTAASSAWDSHGGADKTLSLARSMAQKGDLSGAIAYYGAYLEQAPDVINVRLELIEVLLAAHERQRAQQLCIATLKRKLTKDEFNMVWHLTRQALSI